VGFEETHKAVLVNWWDQVSDADVTRIFGDAFPGWNAEHASLTETSLMEALLPHLVRTEAKARGGAPRTLTYDVFPTPADTVWPNGIGYDASGASAELGKELVELVVRRVGAILDEEFV
jgi:creatinine amidohydrolase